MLHKFFYTTFLFFLAIMQLTAEKQAITVEDLYSLHRISDYSVSPTGEWILYKVSTPDIQENKLKSELFIISIDGKKNLKLSIGEDPIASPVWSPDGKEIAYIQYKDDFNYIYTIQIPNGSPKQIANFESKIANLQFSPDGKHFSFTKSVKIKETVAEKYPKCDKANVRIYTELPVRHWDHWIDENYNHLFIMPIDGPASAAKDIMPNEPFDTPLVPFGGSSEIAWSADSKAIAYTCKKYSGVDFVRNTNSDIYIYNLEKDKTHNLTEGFMGYDKNPSFSPDGKWIAFTSQHRPGFESDKIRLMLFDIEKNEFIDLTQGFDQCIDEFIWTPDSKSIFATATNFGTVQIFKVNLKDKKIVQFSKGHFDYSGLSIPKNGKIVVFGMMNMTRPLEICSISAEGGSVNQITKLNTEKIDRFAPSTFEERWINTRDGKKLHCWIVYPPNFDKNKKYPMITYCQGGPQQMISQAYGYRWNMSLLSSRDYIIVAPNRRGCPGFGQEWIDAITGDWGGKPMQDILDATDAMKQEPFVDNNRCVAIGASAGGFTTFWLAGNHEGRFKALMAHCGVFNFTSMYGSTEELFFTDWEYGGPYWEEKNQSFYKKNSPHNFADKWDVPLLISTGEKDFRVPYTQSLEAFTVAQVKGLPSKLIFYPNETHFIAKPQEYIIWFNEVFDFFDTYAPKQK